MLANYKDLQGKYDVQSKLATIQDEEGLSGTLTNMVQQIQSYEADNGNLKTENLSLKNEINSLKSAVNSLNNTLGEMKTKTREEMSPGFNSRADSSPFGVAVSPM